MSSLTAMFYTTQSQLKFRFKILHGSVTSSIGNNSLNRISDATIVITNKDTNEVVYKYKFPRFNDEQTGLALWMANSAAIQPPYNTYTSFGDFPGPSGSGTTLVDYILPFDVHVDLSTTKTLTWFSNVTIPSHAFDFRLGAKDAN